MSVYTTQTDLKITVNTGINLTGATVKMKYKDPANVAGELDVNLEDANAGVFSYSNTPTNPFSIVGVWCFWAYVTNSNGTISIGDPFKITFNEEGKC